MPAIKCPNGKWRWGRGKCIYDTKGDAEQAGKAIEASKAKAEKHYKGK